MSLSIILPVYNPAGNWIERINEQYAIIGACIPGNIQLVIVNDGSTKPIEEHTVKDILTHVRNLEWISYEKNRGKGFAIRQGVKYATGDIVIYTDVDFPYDLKSFLAIHSALTSQSCDIAIGVKNDQYYSAVPPLRRKISRTLQYMIGHGLSIPVTDTQCGLKGFHRNVAPFFLKTEVNRYLFDLEFIINVFKEKQYRVKAIPVQLNVGVVFRRMNYKILIPEMITFIKLLFK